MKSYYMSVQNERILLIDVNLKQSSYIFYARCLPCFAFRQSEKDEESPIDTKEKDTDKNLNNFCKFSSFSFNFQYDTSVS